MIDPDIEQAEKTVLIQLLTSLKFVIPVLTALLIAAIGAGTNWFQGYSNRPLGAPSTQCSAAQCDSLLAKQFSGATRGVCACCAIYFGAACHPVPPAPSPPPVPVIDAGPPSPVIVGSGSLPKCKGQSLTASLEQVERRRATVKPRVKIPGLEKLITKDTSRLLAPVNPLIAWRFNNAFCGDQGNLGECVSAAANGVSVTQPFSVTFANADALNASFLSGYKWITANDSIAGAYPPNDTGSDTLTGCKWLVKMGYAKSCKVLSGRAQVIDALLVGPIMSGINWPSTAFDTNACGVLDMSGNIVGGHDREIFGWIPANTPPLYLPYDADLEQNSWRNDFGLQDENGHGGLQLIKADDLFSSRLDADFVQPVR